MQSKMVFKICDGTSSLFYAEEFNVIVHERYFPCITLLQFWPFCIPNYQRTWWLGWELGIVTRSYYGRIASVIGVWHRGDQCSIHSVMTIFIKKNGLKPWYPLWQPSARHPLSDTKSWCFPHGGGQNHRTPTFGSIPNVVSSSTTKTRQGRWRDQILCSGNRHCSNQLKTDV